MKNILFILILLAFSISLSAQTCKKEFSKYPLLTENGWSIRIESQIDLYGCKVVKVFDTLLKENAQGIMDAVDENPQLMREVVKLYKHREFVKLMNTNSVTKELVDSNADNPLFLKNLNYLIQKNYNSANRKKISSDLTYLNYYIFSSINAKTTDELKKYHHALKKLSLDELKAFAFIYGTIGDSYDFSLLLENFSTLKKKLTPKQLNLIIQYPQYIAYFLYPSQEEMGIKGDDKFIHKKQQQYQKMIVSFYQSMYKHNITQDSEASNNIALLTLEEIQPYVVSYPQKYYEIEKLLVVLSKQNFLNQLWAQIENRCNKDKKKKVFAIFGDSNLNNLLKLKKDENDLYKHLLYSSSEEKSISSLFYVSNVYAKFTSIKWHIFKDLLYTLPTPSYDIYMNSFVLKELDNIGYFDKVIRSKEYNRFVENDEDVANGKSTAKYRYILLTSYPSDQDSSAFQYIGANRFFIAQNNLDKLYRLSIDELETHNFTTFEKSMSYLNKADWALTGAAVVAAPFTGGTSLLYIVGKTATKQTGKIAAKKGMMWYAKKISIKLANKSIKFARVGRKSLYKTIGEKNTRAFGKGLSKLDDMKDNFTFGTVAAGTVAAYFIMPSKIQAKDICQEGDR